MDHVGTRKVLASQTSNGRSVPKLFLMPHLYQFAAPRESWEEGVGMGKVGTIAGGSSPCAMNEELPLIQSVS